MLNKKQIGLAIMIGGLITYVQASKKMFELYDKRIDRLNAITEAQFDMIKQHTILISELCKR